MPEDPITHSEIAALTRRYEEHAEQTNDALKVIKSDILHGRLEVGTLATRVDALTARVDNLADEIRTGHARLDNITAEVHTGQARIIELLSRLVGRDAEQ